MAASKIAVYSLSDLKNTTDDALPNYLTSLKFIQSHVLTDVRLMLGYGAVTIAAITFYFDYKLGWDTTKTYTLWAVIAYFVLDAALAYWIWAVEKGKVFTGELDGTLVSFASSVAKHVPTYNLSVRYLSSSKPRGDWETLDLAAPFTRWFDADGYFVAKPFQQWVASSIAVVVQDDPKNALHRIGGSDNIDNEAQRTLNHSGSSFSKQEALNSNVLVSMSTKSRKSKK